MKSAKSKYFLCALQQRPKETHLDDEKKNLDNHPFSGFISSIFNFLPVPVEWQGGSSFMKQRKKLDRSCLAKIKPTLILQDMKTDLQQLMTTLNQNELRLNNLGNLTQKLNDVVQTIQADLGQHEAVHGLLRDVSSLQNQLRQMEVTRPGLDFYLWAANEAANLRSSLEATKAAYKSVSTETLPGLVDSAFDFLLSETLSSFKWPIRVWLIKFLTVKGLNFEMEKG